MVDSINASSATFDKFKTNNVNNTNNANSTNGIQPQNYQPQPNATNPLQRTPQSDTVELHNKQGMSKNTKIGIGAAALLGLGVVAYVLTKGRLGSSSVKQLAEHIDFKNAETMEDAVKFAKDNLGVKLDIGDNLMAANFINKMLVDLNNKMKGKSVMPRKVIFDKNIKSADGMTGTAAWVEHSRTLTIGNQYMQIMNACAKRGNDSKAETLMTIWHEQAKKSNSKSYMWDYPMQVIFHEMGHANHFSVCKDARKHKMGRLTELNSLHIKDKHFTEEFLKEVQGNEVVQKYAEENFHYNEQLGCYYPLSSPAEFVADIFGHKMLGKKIPAEVDAIYTKYGGPAVAA